ncbi:MAG: cytosolic protein [Spirochaetes bacterium]|nr:cytosolic protein [Spirochaetota bacterium]
MKAGLLLTGNGALMYLTSHPSHVDETLVGKFKSKGITKFIAYEVPVDEARRRYGGHFEAVVSDLKETDDLRILDYDGSRAFGMFSFKELGQPYIHE